MSFLYPVWLASLITIPVFILAVIMFRRNRAQIWSAFVSSQHKSELVKQNKPLRFWLAFACSLLGLICLIVACARPYSGNSVKREKIQSRNILIAMDTSLSMLCEDVQPNRLSSGVAFAVNLIGALPDDHFGIMAYAGSANVITSLSIDHPSIIEELGHLGPGSAHIAGSNLKDALYEGINTLNRAGKQANALILITDGTETLDEIDEIISIAKESYVQIFTIGVGTSAGGTIPVNGEPHRDRQQKVVITKLQDKILRQLATGTAGVYTHINTQPEQAIATAIQSMTKYEQQGREVQIPREFYQWFLAPGILFLLLSALVTTRFKSSFHALIIISFFTTLSDSQAAETSWTDEISTKYLDRPALIKFGYSSLEKKNYIVAIGCFTQAREGTEGDVHAKLSLAIAQAAYRLKHYDMAVKEYSQALITSQPEIQNISQYNLANTLFKQHTANIDVPAEQDLTSYLEDQIRIGALKDSALDDMETGLGSALTHYRDLLKIEPQHTSAESNRKATELVITAIKEARQTIAEEKKKQQEEKEKEKPKEEPEEDPKKDPESDKKDDQDPSEKPDGEEKGDQKGDQKGEENKEGDAEEKGDEKGKSKDGEGDEKGKGKEGEKPDDVNKKPKKGESDQPPEEGEAKQPDKQDSESTTDKPAKFNNKQEALDFLKKHSDTRKKPLTNRRGYYNRPAIDW